MISMRRFLEQHSVTGEVTALSPEDTEASTHGARHYRVTLRTPAGSYETRCSRSAVSATPTIGEALAEAARRVTGMDEAPDSIGMLRSSEMDRLRALLGTDGAQELVFEFGRRPLDDLESGDPSGASARSDEMTNQEPRVLKEARNQGRRVGIAKMLLPPAVLAAVGSVFLARGRGVVGGAMLVGAASTALGAAARAVFQRRRQATHESDALSDLSDERQSIEAGIT